MLPCLGQAFDKQIHVFAFDFGGSTGASGSRCLLVVEGEGAASGSGKNGVAHGREHFDRVFSLLELNEGEVEVFEERSIGESECKFLVTF